jgi:two-component system phosphate regulon response regulator PhoB
VDVEDDIDVMDIERAAPPLDERVAGEGRLDAVGAAVHLSPGRYQLGHRFGNSPVIQAYYEDFRRKRSGLLHNSPGRRSPLFELREVDVGHPIDYGRRQSPRPLRKHNSRPILRYPFFHRSMARVLVVDDDEQLTELLRVVLEGEGHEVATALGAPSALEALRGERYDLVVLDVMIGEGDGRVVLSEIRKVHDTPVIFISGMGDPADRIAGLRLGADDYLPKPFAPAELAARVATVLRRAKRQAAAGEEVAPANDIVIDERTREVTVGGKKVELTAREFDLLAFMARSPRQVFTRGQLLQNVWVSTSEWQDEATVTEHVRRVRHKIEPDPEKPRYLTTVRGVGYRFEP